MTQDTLPYPERLKDVIPILIRRESLGALLIDLSQLCQTENDHGSGAYDNVLEAATDLIFELIGTEVRKTDILATIEKGGDAFLFFLSPQRTEQPIRLSALQAAAARIEGYLNQSLSDLASPYLRERLQVIVGSAMVFHNPLVTPERQVDRLVKEAWESVRYQQLGQKLRNRSRLQEILLNDELRTFFQPVIDMKSNEVLGYEALSRGPEDFAFQNARQLFEIASESNLVFELDRYRRRRSLADAREIDPSKEIFINVITSSMNDPEFDPAKLCIRLEELELTPEQIVIEMTQESVIENLVFFKLAIEKFLKKGFSFAVDDVGTVQSSLERVACLNPRYLKIDTDLVQEIDESFVCRETVKAIKTIADNIGATIIAEGVEREEERETLLGLDIQYGQGFLLGRPELRPASQDADE